MIDEQLEDGQGLNQSSSQHSRISKFTSADTKSCLDTALIHYYECLCCDTLCLVADGTGKSIQKRYLAREENCHVRDWRLRLDMCN